MTVECDVADGLAVAALHDATLARFGSVDFLMNNAATRVGGGIDGSQTEWRRSMDVNFWGVANGVHAFLPSMLAGGREAMIVNVGSKQGITNPPGNLAYNITKSALKLTQKACSTTCGTSKGAG